MPLCAGKTREDKELDKRNKAADAELKRLKKTRSAEIKMLLLGTGESGKSTFAKQMRILHSDPLDDEEKEQYKATLHTNTLVCMKTLVLAAKHFGYDVSADNEEAATYFVKLNPRTQTELTSSNVRKIKLLWKDRAIQRAFQRRNEFQLMDSCKYFFKNMSRFREDGFQPTNDDVLRCRTRTTGIEESTFTVDDHRFRLVDVGGQRSERRRWIHTFEDVTAVLFFASLTEYDMVLYEDSNANRMEESLDLFDEMANSGWFNRSAFILFLNKLDLFEEKIKRSPLTCLFPEYIGGTDVEGGVDFIREQYMNRVGKKRRSNFHVHASTATDTSNIKVVFDKARQVIISHNLERLGFGRL